jgi:hypothetical protein
LLSIKFYILTKTDAEKINLAQIKEKYETSEFVDISNMVKKHNEILNQLNSFYDKEIYFSEVLNIISNIEKPENLYLTNFSLSRNSIGEVDVNITGISSSRDDLLVFKKNIEESKDIKNPLFSSGSWISPKNAKFSLTFKISQDEK